MSDKLALYLSKRDLIHSGDSLAWDSDTLLGGTIQEATDSELNHISIAARFNDINHERVWSFEELGLGADFNILSNRLDEHKGRVWVYPLDPIFDDLRIPLIDWAMGKKGTPYDYYELCMSLFRRPPLDDEKMICSEYYFFGFYYLMKQRLDHPGWKRLDKVMVNLKGRCPWPSDWPMLQECGIFTPRYQIY